MGEIPVFNGISALEYDNATKQLPGYDTLPESARRALTRCAFTQGRYHIKWGDSTTPMSFNDSMDMLCTPNLVKHIQYMHGQGYEISLCLEWNEDELPWSYILISTADTDPVTSLPDNGSDLLEAILHA